VALRECARTQRQQYVLSLASPSQDPFGDCVKRFRFGVGSLATAWRGHLQRMIGVLDQVKARSFAELGHHGP
jgi:hypothetical protein